MKNLTKSERSWVLYDWANSVHSTIISTAIFPLWFGQVARNGGLSGTQTTFWLGTANFGYAAIVAVLAALLGTLSDFKGYRKRLFVPFWLLGVIATGALVFTGASAWVFALVLYVLTFIGFAGANIFYDASITDVTTLERMDMVSSMGFGYGYIGGSTIPFLISLVVIALLSGMDFSGGLPTLGVKFSFALTALWWFVFTFPFLRNVKQKHGIEPVANPVVESFRRLGKTFSRIRSHKKIFVFLIAYFFYIDGVNTIIKMASNFVDSLGVGLVVLLGSLVGIQILAFPFAILYGRLAKNFGAKRMLFWGIGVYIVITALGTVMPLVGRAAVVPIFIAVSLLVASSQGGIQAISRSYFAGLIPNENVSGEFFGFYNTFGKFAAIMGPLIMGGLPRLAERIGIANERVAYSFGVGGILLLFLIGGGLLVLSTRTNEPDFEQEVI